MSKTFQPILTSKKVMGTLGGAVGGWIGLQIGFNNFAKNFVDYAMDRGFINEHHPLSKFASTHTQKDKNLPTVNIPRWSDVTLPTIGDTTLGIFGGNLSAQVLSKAMTSPQVLNTVIKKIK